MKFGVKTTQLTVFPVCVVACHDQETVLTIVDEGAGDFVSITQPCRGIASIQIEADEWPAIKEAIERLLATIKDGENE